MRIGLQYLGGCSVGMFMTVIGFTHVEFLNTIRI